MKKIGLLFFALVLCCSSSEACTNFLVGKKASADGSVFISYSADSYGMSGFIAHFPAAVHPVGTMRDIYNWDSGDYIIPQTYTQIKWRNTQNIHPNFVHVVY